LSTATEDILAKVQTAKPPVDAGFIKKRAAERRANRAHARYMYFVRRRVDGKPTARERRRQLRASLDWSAENARLDRARKAHEQVCGNSCKEHATRAAVLGFLVAA
jgi:hypothetical protein